MTLMLKAIGIVFFVVFLWEIVKILREDVFDDKES